jgi:hypothetical protein
VWVDNKQAMPVRITSVSAIERVVNKGPYIRRICNVDRALLCWLRTELAWKFCVYNEML